ncbi:MAG: NADPH:quinone oxidoreductase family protein [Parasphingorhabdus sp.]|nr:NADPH:quinone oxidoreductase family protein [Parasphingorhabdus sp.]
MRDTYRAAVCTALTGPDSISIKQLPARALRDGEVRVAVHAAGLNFPDLLMTYGKYQHRPDPPFVPGMEMAGLVIEAAADVTRFAVGDRVMGGAKGGAFAEQIVLPATALRTLPPALSFAQGACWHVAAATAWHALHDKAALQPSENILILGASGGVGMAAIKLAKHLGANVIATASTDEKRAAVLEAGADHALDPAADDLAAQVKALTGGAGGDVVYDPVGGDLALTATRAIAWGGRYLIVGFASGSIPNFPANHALIKGYSLIGLRAGESARRDPALAMRSDAALAELAARGVMRPLVSRFFALDDTRGALRALEHRFIIGRGAVQLV